MSKNKYKDTNNKKGEVVGTGGGKVGSVMVVGAGIAGMESSLGLADSGYLVYLVSKEPTVGGRMAQLDKTFPTNDCSTCMISPRMVSVGSHPNIDIITMADVDSVSGEAGNFKVKVRKQPRYIDESKCTGCAECTTVCPVHIPDPNNENLSDRGATYRLFPQAVPNWFAITRDRTAPCKNRCPAHISVQGYVNLIAEGRFKDALEVIRQRNPFPSVCGRVCFHPCEEVCNRGQVDEPVAINNLKRFVSDIELEEAGVIPKKLGVTEDPSKNPWKNIEPAQKREEKVAIIGAGPSGLTAAHDLALWGFKCTVFEKLPMAGGMLAVGIPEYRLPMKVLQYEIDRVKQLGVEIKLNTAIDKNNGIDKLFEQGYKAVYIAVGSHGSMKLRVRGEELPGVMSGIDYLRDITLGEKTELGKNVAVIGGGNVAMDAARTAIREGAKVTVVYRRSRQEMPAHEWEIAEAEREGIEFKFLTTPLEIVAGAGGRVDRLKCIQNELGEPDASGRRRPVPIDGSEFDIELDTVIAAIGQATEVDFLTGKDGVETTKWGTVITNEKTGRTDREGVFSGGDCVTGPGMAIEAIGAGKNAAESIRRYLLGEDIDGARLEDELMASTPLDEHTINNAQKASRPRPKLLPYDQRTGNFDEVEMTITAEEAVAEAKRCLNCGPCADCRLCEITCQKEAIDFTQTEQITTYDVGAMILSPGYKLFDPRELGEFGFDHMDNVITSMQFERMLSASGPYEGHVARPSDHEEPKRIAFIQCVGSRNERIGRGYCSSVCCMYATKQAIIGMEHCKGSEVSIFYRDLRAFGKGFDRYWQSARDKNGVRYVKASISTIKEDPNNKNLILRYLEGDSLKEEEFDMVILSCGLVPNPDGIALCNRLGVDLDKYGFAETDPNMPIATNREGIYVCGAFESPKDIPESVVQSTGAAGKAMALLGDARWTATSTKEYPEPLDVKPEDEVRMGVFICHCGINIAGVVDVKRVAEDAGKQPGVVHAEDILFTCSQDSQDLIRRIIKEKNLNRVVVASCSPRTHEPLFREMLKEAGLNPYLFEMANIRDQCSWVHYSHPEKATEKAIGLARMAIAKARKLESLQSATLDVTHTGLVIGGGAAGMTAAQSLADQGFDVHLVERAAQLGGEALNLRYAMDGSDIRPVVEKMIDQITNNPKITIHFNSELADLSGGVGAFKSTLTSGNGDGTQVIEHGALVIATGAKEYKPTEYMYGQDEHVMTTRELEMAVASGKLNPKELNDIVFIQCVGSRCDERDYCSRVCCSQTVKNTIKLKEMNPDLNIYVMYRDIRTYGMREDYYRRARDLGVIFVRYDKDEPPEVTKNSGRLAVTVKDQMMGRVLEFPADAVSLAAAVVPRTSTRKLAKTIKVSESQDGFFLEAHVKLRPIDFALEGAYMAGTAHSPMSLDEAVSQGLAAAAHAGGVLGKEKLQGDAHVAHVNEDLCAGCVTCVRVCPYGVPQMNMRGKAEISPLACHGCGTCVSQCPAKAIELPGFTYDQISCMCNETYSFDFDKDKAPAGS